MHKDATFSICNVLLGGFQKKTKKYYNLQLLCGIGLVQECLLG